MKINPNYKYSEKIPSLYVNKDLLENLESYFLEKIPVILNVNAEIIRNKYKLIIKDSNGEEEISSIKDFNLNIFPNDTKEISLNLYFWNDNQTNSITIYLDKDRIGAKIKIEISNSNPKETTNGIISGLNQILFQNKNNNFLFHPNIWVDAIISGIGFLAFWVSLNIFQSNVKLSISFLSVSIISLSYLSILKKLKPYISFDSNKQRKYDRNTSWLFYSFLAFIIFGNLLVYLKNLFI